MCKSSENMMHAFCMMRAAVLMVSPKSRNLRHPGQKLSQAFTWLQNIAFYFSTLPSNPLPKKFGMAVSTALAASVQSLLQPQRQMGKWWAKCFMTFPCQDGLTRHNTLREDVAHSNTCDSDSEFRTTGPVWMPILSFTCRNAKRIRA